MLPNEGCISLHSYQQCTRVPFSPQPHQHLFVELLMIAIWTGGLGPEPSQQGEHAFSSFPTSCLKNPRSQHLGMEARNQSQRAIQRKIGPASRKMHYYRYSNAEVSCWYKYLLFSYNIVFWLAGVAFLGAGLWAWSEKGVLSDLTKVTRLHGIDPVVLVLVVGVVMFTLGFAGCVGALRENICLLKFFCGTIVLIFFLELAVAVLAFLFQDWVRDRFREFFESNIRSYRDDIDLQNLIDSLQKANQCCGAYSPEDWDLNVYFNCSGASYSREKCGVPFSCCVPDPAQKVLNTQCGYDVRTQLKSKWDEFIFTKGCIPALEGWLPRNIYIVAGVFIAISLLQIFGIFLAKTLISDIEAVKAGHHF